MTSVRIIGDRWRGTTNDEWIVENPTRDQPALAIRQLDTRVHTLVMAMGAEEQHLGVGGGNGRFVVYATFDSNTFWNLTCADTAYGNVLLNAGGQDGHYPSNLVVDAALAEEAATTFLETFGLAPTGHWRQQRDLPDDNPAGNDVVRTL